MPQFTFHWRFLALLVLLAAFSLVPVALPNEACAKGGFPTIAKITGPGLTKAIHSRGPDFPGPLGAWLLPRLTGAHHYKAVIYAASGGLLDHDEAPGADVQLGPRYKVIFSVWRRQHGPRVLQYIYPFAASGPLTFTPAGQKEAFAHVFSEFEIRGWWSAPNELTKWLREKGVTMPRLHSFASSLMSQEASSDRPTRNVAQSC